MNEKASNKVISQAQYTIIDMQDGVPGADGYTVILTNDTHAIQCDFLGNPLAGEIGNPTCKASSEIIVLKGDKPLTPVGQNDTVINDTFKYILEPKTVDSSCLGERVNNKKFYLKELYADSGSLLLNIILDNEIIVKKEFTWSKVLHGEDAKYIKLRGDTVFKYEFLPKTISGRPLTGNSTLVGQIETRTTPIPPFITITADIYNIKQYSLTWQYLNESGEYTQIVSAEGCLIKDNTLTIDDKKLWGETKLLKIRAICTDSESGKEYVDDIVIYKQYDGETPEKPEDAKYVTLTGLSYFNYDNKNDTTSTPERITITPSFHNIINYRLKWKYRNDNKAPWLDVVSKEGSLIEGDTLTVNDKICFVDSTFAEFNLLVTDLDNNKVYNATHTISKLYNGEDGEDSYTCILTNESDTILFDQNGIVKPGQIGSNTCKAYSTIIAKKGTQNLNPVSDTITPSTGQYHFKFEPAPVNCTARKNGDSSFYLDTISEGSENGKISISIYLEGSVNKIVKEYTWNKVIDGVDARYLILEGEDKFVYDSPSDTTSTPETITLTATAFNIPNPTYIWKWFNGSMTEIVSGSGATISNNKLTIDDKKLFPNGAKTTKIQCESTYEGKTYSDTLSIIKSYNGEDGDPGPPGNDAKTVQISGATQIHYDKTNTPNPTSIELTATAINYVNANLKWYYVTSSGATLIENQTSNTLTVEHNSIYFNGTDIAQIKVECRENNGTDMSFTQHTITKTYDGEDATSLVLNIVDGTRNICYNGKGKLVTTVITPFRFELYEDSKNVTSSSDVKSISWSCKGHYEVGNANIGAITFRPSPINDYDESKLDTFVSVTINYKGRIIKQSAPIAVSKNSTALDWVEEWDGTKVDIGGNYIISPKIFAGKKDAQTNTITGVALGQDIINKNPNIGVAIYYENKVIGKINSDPSLDDDNVISFGTIADKQFILKSNGRVEIGGGVKLGASSVEEVVTYLDDITKKGIGANNYLYNTSEFTDTTYWRSSAKASSIEIVDENLRFSSEVVNETELTVSPGETYVFSATIKLPKDFVMTPQNLLNYIKQGV